MNAVLREARATVLLAIPITIGQLSQMLMGVTDTVMIGRTGTVPLAASSFGGGIFNVLFVVGVGILVPISVFVSRSRGADRHDEAGEYLRHGILVSLVAGVLGCALIAALSAHLSIFGQPPEVTAAVNPFLLLIGVSLIPALGYLALRQFAESMGHPWMPTLVILACVGVNVVLNWVFIYGHWGSPPFGLTGAGIATLLSRILATAVIYFWLRSDPAMGKAWPGRWLAPASRARLVEMMHVGLPAAGGLLFETGAFCAATVMVGWLGAVPLAAHQIAVSCAATTFMVALGIAIAVGVRTSAAIGAGQRARARDIWVGAAAMGASYAAVLTVVFIVFGHGIAGLFVGDGAVVAVTTRLLVIVGIFQLFDGNQVINSSALRGMTDVKVPAVITFVAYWLIAVPLAYLFGIRWGYGPTGVWWGLAAGLALAALALGGRFLRLTRGASAGA
jgi:MATE family multidrug resistance protein